MKPKISKYLDLYMCQGGAHVGIGTSEESAYAIWLRLSGDTASYLKCPVPEMTDPMGKHWRQPSTERMVFTPKHVFVWRDDFRRLSEYSTSTPSGVYPGKMWRRNEGSDWYLMWYGISPNLNRCTIEQRKIIWID